MTTLPVLPLRDIVVFPQMIVPLFVGRDKSVKALEAVMAGDKRVFLVSQKNPGDEDPGADDLYDIGTLATVLQLLKLPDGTVKVLVEGQARARVGMLETGGEYLVGRADDVEETIGDATLVEGLVRSTAKQFEAYVKLNKKTAPEIAVQIGQIEDAGRFADTIAANLTLKIADKQSLLGQTEVAKRLEAVFAFMEGEMGVLQVEKKIRSRVKRQMEKTQREYYLNEQMKAIQKRVGRRRRADQRDRRAAAIEEKSIAVGMPDAVEGSARQASCGELKTVQGEDRRWQPPSTTVVAHLPRLAGRCLPWQVQAPTKVKRDLVRRQEDPRLGSLMASRRPRIAFVEYLAVQEADEPRRERVPSSASWALQALARRRWRSSIAQVDSTRKLVRVSPSAVCGTRPRSAVTAAPISAALPGQIIQNLKKAG